MLVQVLVSGIAIGCVYGLIALALVLINKSTDVVNFAQGEMAMFGAFVALVLHRDLGIPLFVVLILALPVGGAIGLVTERVVIRPLTGAPINALIATIGLGRRPDGDLRQISVARASLASRCRLHFTTSSSFP